MYCWVFIVAFVALAFALQISQRVLMFLSRHSLNPVTQSKTLLPEITGRNLVAALSKIGVLAIRIRVFGEDPHPESSTAKIHTLNPQP